MRLHAEEEGTAEHSYCWRGRFDVLPEICYVEIVFNQDLTNSHHLNGIDVILYTDTRRQRKICRFILRGKGNK